MKMFSFANLPLLNQSTITPSIIQIPNRINTRAAGSVQEPPANVPEMGGNNWPR